MKSRFVQQIETSRRKLLETVGPSADITFIRIHGNVGDDLIYAGTRQLLSQLQYREISVRSLDAHAGDTAIVAGSGGWCHAYHSMPGYLEQIEQRFERVIVFPSSFDVSEESVRNALSNTKALIFAREQQSYDQIRDLCNADTAHDCAFFFDYRAYQRRGHGVLNAFREDGEAAPFEIPRDNEDISRTCESLDEWLWKIAHFETVRTDRAHVTIAGALLGKNVRYRTSNYHKVSAIVEFALQDFSVERIPDNGDELPKVAAALRGPCGRIEEDTWEQQVAASVREIAMVVPTGQTFILVDGNRLGVFQLAKRRIIPFLERGGQYWGPPPDDHTAIEELQRLCEAKPAFLIFAWPAFWWLDYYPQLTRYLRSNYVCRMENERIVVFDLFCKQTD